MPCAILIYTLSACCGCLADGAQVERVIAKQRQQAGEARCLVKWRGLAYEHATWELRSEVDADAIHEVRFLFEVVNGSPRFVVQ